MQIANSSNNQTNKCSWSSNTIQETTGQVKLQVAELTFNFFPPVIGDFLGNDKIQPTRSGWRYNQPYGIVWDGPRLVSNLKQSTSSVLDQYQWQSRYLCRHLSSVASPSSHQRHEGGVWYRENRHGVVARDTITATQPSSNWQLGDSCWYWEATLQWPFNQVQHSHCKQEFVTANVVLGKFCPRQSGADLPRTWGPTVRGDGISCCLTIDWLSGGRIGKTNALKCKEGESESDTVTPENYCQEAVSCLLTSKMVGGAKLRRCYVCEKEVEMEGTVKEHMKKHAGPRSKVQFRLSNCLADVCKTACKLCGKVLPLQRMRSHTKEKHGMGITDYKTNFNQVIHDLYLTCIQLEQKSLKCFSIRTSLTWRKRSSMNVEFAESR